MADLEVIQVIHTFSTRRGNGHDESSPIRVIEQYWGMDGKLLFEINSMHDQPDTYSTLYERCKPVES